MGIGEQNLASTRLSAPRVSVIIPAYNASRYIPEALDSVFAQSFQDLEVIVVNDGSSDTPQLQAALRPYAGRLFYIEQPNRGVSAARNFAIQRARGDLLAFLDADDVWLPQYLEVQVNFLNEHPGAVAAVSDVLRFGESAPKPYERRMLGSDNINLLSFDDMLRRKGGQLPSATVVRRASALASGLFDESLRVGEDIDFCIRVCFPEGTIGYTKQMLVKYRWHGAGAATTLTPRQIKANEAECLRRAARKLPLTPGQRSVLTKEVEALEAELAMMDAHEALTRQEFDRAASHLAEANKYYRHPRISLAVQGLKMFPGWTARILIGRMKR
jgi:glycosyltransferase involved in cell wall biosynthesis